MDVGLSEVRELALYAICDELTDTQLDYMRRSVEQAGLMPKRAGWDRRAAAHANLFWLLAATAEDPGFTRALHSSARLACGLMVRAGPGVNGITVVSCKRLLSCLSDGDPDGAAREMERYLTLLSFLVRLQSPISSGDVH